MEGRSVVHGTFVIERRYPAPPERVFAAFADPAIKRRWFAEGEGFQVESFESDFRVGGLERCRFTVTSGPVQGQPITNETVYQDIVENRRIVLAYTMALGEKRFSASLLTVELLPRDGGTELVLTEQGAFFEGADGLAMREAGTRELLEALARELAAKRP